MPYDIKLTNAEAILTAVIRSRVQPTELSKFVPTACGEVWSFIRSAGLRRPGRHVALYLDSGLVEVGAEVSERFVNSFDLRVDEPGYALDNMFAYPTLRSELRTQEEYIMGQERRGRPTTGCS